jgi:hypothetical protein
MLVVVFVYGLPALTSISESATTGNRAGMLLPFALGCMFTYGIAHVGYCRSERVVTRIMAVSFAVVAMQICDSIHIAEDRVGMFGLSPNISHIVHTAASVVGFGAMFVWIAFFFTRKSANPTREKLIRNSVYRICAGFMLAGIIVFVIGMFGAVGTHYVFIAEEFLLIPAGVAVITKSGLILKDS